MSGGVLRRQFRGFLELGLCLLELVRLQERFSECPMPSRVGWRDLDRLSEVWLGLAGALILDKQSAEVEVRPRIVASGVQRNGFAVSRQCVLGLAQSFVGKAKVVRRFDVLRI